ncbi:IS1096 element passenger TnpR family protein [Mesorhizobium sp. BHbsci]
MFSRRRAAVGLWQPQVRLNRPWSRKSSPRAITPRLVAGKCACPPEDCGGRGAMQTRLGCSPIAAARRRELVEWLGGPFDPEAFDMDEVRR